MVHWRQASGGPHKRARLPSSHRGYILRGGKPLPFNAPRDQASVCETYISTSGLNSNGRAGGQDVAVGVVAPYTAEGERLAMYPQPPTPFAQAPLPAGS